MPEPFSEAWRRLPYAVRFPTIYELYQVVSDGKKPTDAELVQDARNYILGVCLETNSPTDDFDHASDDVILHVVENRVRAVLAGEAPPPSLPTSLQHPISFN